MSDNQFEGSFHFLELDYEDTPPEELLNIQRNIDNTWQVLETDSSEIEKSTVDTTSELEIKFTPKKVLKNGSYNFRHYMGTANLGGCLEEPS